MIRVRSADGLTGEDVNEFILPNSHDGASSFHMLGGVFRFVCQNGMVVGETVGEVRVRHKGAIASCCLTRRSATPDITLRFKVAVRFQPKTPAFEIGSKRYDRSRYFVWLWHVC